MDRFPKSPTEIELYIRQIWNTLNVHFVQGVSKWCLVVFITNRMIPGPSTDNPQIT